MSVTFNEMRLIFSLCFLVVCGAFAQRTALPADAVTRARGLSTMIEKGLVRQDALKAEGRGQLVAAIPEYAAKAQASGAFVDIVLHARILALAGANADSEARFAEARAMEPASPWPVFGVATCKALAGEKVAAISLFEETLHLDPEWWRSLEPLSGLYLNTGRPVDAERVLARLVKVRPEDASAFATLGQLRLLIGQASGSADAYARAVALRPEDPTYRRAFGIACRRAGRYDEARAAFEADLAARPKDYRAHVQLAYLEEWQGRNAVAADRFRKAADFAPTPADRDVCMKKAADLEALPSQDEIAAARRSPSQWAEVLAGSKDPKVAVEAAQRLAAMPPTVAESTRALVGAVRHPVPAVRILAIRALSARFPGSTDLLTVYKILSRDADRGVRAMAIRALGDLAVDEVVPTLIPLLAETDPYVFREVHEALYRAAPAFVTPIYPLADDGTARAALVKEWQAWWAENADRYRRFLR